MATRGLGRRIALNATSLAVGGLVAQAAMVAIEAIIARTLGQASYGIYSTAYAFGLAGLFLIEVGMSWKLIENGSRDQRTMPVLLGTTLVLKCLLALVVYPLMLIGFAAIGQGPEAVGFLAVLMLFVVLMAVQNSFAAVYSARVQMHVNALFQGATPVAILLLVAAGAAGQLTLAAVGVAFVAGSLVVTLAWAWTTFRLVRPQVQLRDAPQILRGSYLYGASGLLLHVSERLEIILLSILRPMAEVGVFAAADKLIDVGLKVATLGFRTVAPVLFRQSREQPDVFEQSCRRVIRVAAVVGVGGGLGLSLVATWIMPAVFGGQFSGAGVILSVLAVSLALRFIGQAVQLVLVASDRQVRRTAAQATGLAAAVAANLALIPVLGGLGAAFARTAGDLVQIVLLLAGDGLPWRRGNVLAWILGPVLLGAGCFWVSGLVGSQPVLRLATGLGLYGALVLLTGVVRVGEVRALLGRGNSNAGH